MQSSIRGREPQCVRGLDFKVWLLLSRPKTIAVKPPPCQPAHGALRQTDENIWRKPETEVLVKTVKIATRAPISAYLSRAHAWRRASRHLADERWLERRGGGQPARWQRRCARHRPREGRSRRSSSASRSPHVRECALRKKSNPVLSPRRGCQRSLPAVKGARRWLLNPREGWMAARLTCEVCACVCAAGLRGSKKPRVRTMAIRL